MVTMRNMAAITVNTRNIPDNPIIFCNCNVCDDRNIEIKNKEAPTEITVP